MEETTKDYSHINGWGIDADPKNDPTYPLKHRTDEVQKGQSWERPAQQSIQREVLHSTERQHLTAVFGTAAPPRGLSGLIRKYAYKQNEGSVMHWFPLIMADRVDVVEGILEDMKEGKVTNIFAEKGYSADWKFNKSGLFTRMAIGAAIAGAAVLYFAGEKKRKKWFYKLMEQ